MADSSRMVKDGVAPVIVAAKNGHHPQLNGGGLKDGRKVSAPLLESDAGGHGTLEPPDGGTRAWLVMVGAFLCNGVLFGVINTYSVVYLSLRKQLQEDGDDEASSKAALVGSLTIGTTFLLSPVSGILTDKIGLRRTTFIGGLLTCGGMFLSSFVTHSVSALYFTYGIMFGLGAALAYTPSLAILGHYFKRYLGLVNGIVTAGSSVFTAIMPICLEWLIEHTGLATSFRILAIISSFVIFCALLYKPLQPPPPPPKVKPGRSAFSTFLRSFINFDNWKKRRYIIWAVSIPIALFGYFVPYVHMGKFVEDNFPKDNKNLPVMCIGITSGLGRLLFGFIADKPGVNRVLLQQMSFVLIGVLTMCLPATGSFWLLLAIALAMGLFDGCFISLLGPIAYDICGPRGATQAIGFLLGMCSLPLTIGPPVAGMLYDKTGSYLLPFILAGIPPLFGASTMFLIRCVKDEEPKKPHLAEPKLEPLAHPAWDCENGTDGKPQNGALHHDRRATLASSESLTADKHETG
ncbi:monocarboxylate transporter 10 [Anopheles ziemanni]|uniref:monocarboxylate transporter 10 n=1 Tax=Anopheles coustani TaxID=139045 RepID=UPI002659BCEB|nr:monocarboxylate transporter 10 [Anopheles coustani]XP_058166651.1 monocarboxylate transporter 10 [Anopheles ziemanni]